VNETEENLCNILIGRGMQAEWKVGGKLFLIQKT